MLPGRGCASDGALLGRLPSNLMFMPSGLKKQIRSEAVRGRDERDLSHGKMWVWRPDPNLSRTSVPERSLAPGLNAGVDGGKAGVTARQTQTPRSAFENRQRECRARSLCGCRHYLRLAADKTEAQRR